MGGAARPLGDTLTKPGLSQSRGVRQLSSQPCSSMDAIGNSEEPQESKLGRMPGTGGWSKLGSASDRAV